MLKQRPPKDGIVRRAVTLGRCVLVARVRGAGGGYCSARVLSARFDLPALCIDGPRSADVRRVPISIFERSRSRAYEPVTADSVIELLFFICVFVCVCVFFLDGDHEEIMPKSLCDWTDRVNL